MKTTAETYQELDAQLRKVALAEIGGFQPPDDPLTSWFGGPGIGQVGEELPKHKGKDMFCLLQVRVSELPVVPPELQGVEVLVVFINRDEIPFDQPHGQGWEIREYPSADGLVPLPKSKLPARIKSFPIRWHQVDDDAPDWENAWDLMDMTPILESGDEDERFFEAYQRYPGTKVGGFPFCIQHGHDLEGFVFQIGSEVKAQWMWADSGVAYFKKDRSGQWVMGCQCY